MANENIDQEMLKCPQCELSVLGTFFKSPMTYFSFTDVVQNSDFSDGSTRFWHVFVDKYLLTYSNEVTPALLNTFASMDSTRLQGYRKFGGYNTVKAMMDLALDEQGLMNAVQMLKKYSLVRNLAKDGFDIENIVGSNKFSSMDAEDIAALMQGKLDMVCNNSIVSVNKPNDMAKGAGSFVDSFFTVPSRGIQTPFNFINEYCMGLMGGDVLFWGSLSNAGKGRSLMYVACHLAMVGEAKVTILENEMDLQRMNQAFITTACNAPYAQAITGCKLAIPEKRLVQASYLDNTTGLPMYRYYDKSTGEYTETAEQYRARVAKHSDEYNMVKEVTNYLEKNVRDKMLFKNVASNYSDTALLRHLNQSVLTEGSDIVIYDTIKNASSTSGNSKIGDWAALLNTATILQEATAKLKTVSSIMSFQLDRSSYKKRIEELSADNVASSSGMLTIADQMIMFLHMKKEDYKDYKIAKKMDVWGKDEIVTTDLDANKNYSAFRIMKNRRSGGKDKIFLTETDLNLNTWCEADGQLVVEKMRPSNWEKK